MGVGGWGWVESIIRLISAEAEAFLGLAVLGKILLIYGTDFIFAVMSRHFNVSYFTELRGMHQRKNIKIYIFMIQNEQKKYGQFHFKNLFSYFSLNIQGESKNWIPSKYTVNLDILNGFCSILCMEA